MHAKLVVVGGKANKSQVSLKLPSVLGRSREADLTITHPMISRRHCEIFEVGGVLRIRDLGSLNGTFVRQKQIREAELQPNDEFTIGPLTFRVEYRLSPATPPPGVPTGGAVVPETVQFAEQPADGVSRAELAGIAPPNGQLPDLDAWDSMAGSAHKPEQAVSPVDKAVSRSEAAPPAAAAAPDAAEIPPAGPAEEAEDLPVDETDFELAGENDASPGNAGLADLDALLADVGQTAEAPQDEPAHEEPAVDEELKNFFKRL
jgi:predicted component of type VI protein secretion system